MPRENVQVRFWSKVDRSKEDDCWLWTAGVARGYGAFNNGEKIVLAHRFSYELHHGPIPTGLAVLHSCDTPRCVNPSHLSVGTWAENARQARERGLVPTKKHGPRQPDHVRPEHGPRIVVPNPSRQASHCLRGHVLSGDNLKVYNYPGRRIQRVCLACEAIRNAKKRQERAA